MKLNFFSFLLILLPISTFQQCIFCPVEHVQTTYCKEQFVIVATVVKQRAEPDPYRFGTFIIFKLKILDVYKMTQRGRLVLDTEEIWSLNGVDTCGVGFPLNKTFLISGGASADRAYVNSCGIIREFETLTDQEIYYFKGEYQDGCDCNTCYRDAGFGDEPCPLADDPNMCKILEPRATLNPLDYQLCQRDNNGTCRWTKKHFLLRNCEPWEN